MLSVTCLLPKECSRLPGVLNPRDGVGRRPRGRGRQTSPSPQRTKREAGLVLVRGIQTYTPCCHRLHNVHTHLNALLVYLHILILSELPPWRSFYRRSPPPMCRSVTFSTSTYCSYSRERSYGAFTYSNTLLTTSMAFN